MTQIVDMAAFRGPTAQMVDLSKFTFWGPPQDMDFFYKQSTRTGQAWLRSIHGRTVSYNQLVQNGDFSDGTTGWTGNRVTLTAANNVLTATMAGTFSTSSISHATSAKAGHKVRMSILLKADAATQIRFFNTSAGVSISSSIAVSGNVQERVSVLYDVPAGVDMSAFIIYLNWATELTDGQKVLVYDVQITDLTQAGLDSIITTPEQFEAWQMEQFGHKGYLGYTLGKLVSVNPTGIKTTTPGGDEHTLLLDFTEHFPTGMNGVNDVVDEAVSDENGKFKEGGVRFGKVDIGTLNWRYNSQFDCFTANISTVAAAAKARFKAICPTYRYVGSYLARVDKSLFYIYDTDVAIKDSSYNGDYTAFKAAMSGIPLIYELATPQHVTFTDPSDAVYPVTEGGTEQVLPVNGSEPTTGPLLGKVSYKQGRSAQ